MAAETKAKKRGFRAPHALVIMVILVCITALLTYVVPAGEFDRTEDPVTGNTIVVADSYHRVEQTPVSLLRVPGIMYQSMVDAADIVIFLLMIGGAFEIIHSTGAITALSCKVAQICGKRKNLVIIFFMVLFAIFGTTMGMSTEVCIFVPIGISVVLPMGFDRVTGTAMIAMGAACGFTAGVLNSFNVGVAQEIAEVPLFSGAGLRVALLVVLVAVSSAYIIRYANRVKVDPTRSIVYGLGSEYEYEEESQTVEMTTRHVLILLTVLVAFVALIYGVSQMDFWYEEMTAIFLVMGVVGGLIAGYGPNKIASVFSQGAKGITGGALIVGFARGISLVMADGQIIDTVINALSQVVMNLSGPVQVLGMYVVQNLINVLITSGSGQAVVVMPIMAPIADLVGMSRQTAVLAFQMGDGFSNSILPTSSATMGYLSAAKIPYEKWLKFMLPLFGIWFVVGAIFMLIASAIGY